VDLKEQIASAVAKLDCWLDTMRGPGGYGGPVTHWWQDSLLYTGAGLDWRYEGIITGYLNLYERTGEEGWLAKARRAGDDLVGGQLPGGNFYNSCFELNPNTGGMPHEAACDLALLRLALALKEAEDPGWAVYASTAEKNLTGFVTGVLWDGQSQVFWNSAVDDTFVPNKAASALEAVFAWASLTGERDPVERYGLPVLEAIVGCQVRAPQSTLDGAICQAVRKGGRDERFFPFYVARCIPALIQGSRLLGQEGFLQAARAAMRFILRHRQGDGSFPQVVYGRHSNRFPQWVAGVGDILGAMDLMAGEGMEIDGSPTLGWLLSGIQDSGAVCTARGFANQIGQKASDGLPDFRDLVGVCGWADKAFRYLTSQVTALRPMAVPESKATELPCLFRGARAVLREDDRLVEVRRGSEVVYRWGKGAPWAEGAWA
jgi:hypothetical protein